MWKWLLWWWLWSRSIWKQVWRRDLRATEVVLWGWFCPVSRVGRCNEPLRICSFRGKGHQKWRRPRGSCTSVSYYIWNNEHIESEFAMNGRTHNSREDADIVVVVVKPEALIQGFVKWGKCHKRILKYANFFPCLWCVSFSPALSPLMIKVNLVNVQKGSHLKCSQLNTCLMHRHSQKQREKEVHDHAWDECDDEILDFKSD